MPRPDATAKAALAGPAFAAVFYLWLDISGDPLRFTNFGQTTTISGSGDSELDGIYPAFGGQLLEIGDINNSDGGSDTLIVTLSGIVSMDTTLLNEIGNKALWQGRLCRIWCRLYDETGTTTQGAIFPLYTGYMSNVRVTAAPDEQAIQLSVENWRAAFHQPSNRTYLGQKDYDSADTSAQATIAASNGLRRDSGAGAAAGAGGFGGGRDGQSLVVHH